MTGLRGFDALEPSFADLDTDEVCEFVADQGAAKTGKDRFVLYSVHDGDRIPALLRRHFDPIEFVRERDFGADALAAVIQAVLSLRNRMRFRLARCLLDGGRFHGLDTPGAAHTSRASIPARIGSTLTPVERLWLDRAHAGVDTAIDRLRSEAAPGALSIGVHTFDPLGADGTPRPELSLLDLPESVARGREAIRGYSNPELRCERFASTADPMRMDRLRDLLETAGFQVTRNDPYRLPDGAVELRTHHRAERSGEPIRPSAFVLEVRKDLLFTGEMRHGGFAPCEVIAGAIERIGSAVAGSLNAVWGQ